MIMPFLLNELNKKKLYFFNKCYMRMTIENPVGMRLVWLACYYHSYISIIVFVIATLSIS